jgi:nicotinate-nucleotide adenylyltransferase
VVGADAFFTLPTWHRWRDILQRAHLVVIARPGVAFPGARPDNFPGGARGELATLWNARHTRAVHALQDAEAGAIISVDVGANDISATTIRKLLAHSPHSADLARLLPGPVLAYIENHHLYHSFPDAP